MSGMENALVRSYRDLLVWQRSVELVTKIYKCTRDWPTDERFGLISQVRRAAVSVPSNIAEGNGRQSPGEDVHSLGIALGSLFETETQLIIAKNLGYAKEATVDAFLAETGHIGRMLYGLINTRKQRKSARKP